jgi:hypothetical protein
MALDIGTILSAILALFVSRWIWEYAKDPLKDIPGKNV